MANFTKTDLVRELTQQTGMSKADADVVVSRVFQIIKEQADAGSIVSIPSFGRFSMKERAARQGRNPATGEPLQIAASRSLGFKASKPAA